MAEGGSSTVKWCLHESEDGHIYIHYSTTSGSACHRITEKRSQDLVQLGRITGVQPGGSGDELLVLRQVSVY